MKNTPGSAPSRTYHLTSTPIHERTSSRPRADRTTILTTIDPPYTSPTCHSQSTSCPLKTSRTNPSSYITPTVTRRSPRFQNRIVQKMTRSHAHGTKCAIEPTTFVDLDSPTLDKSGVWEEFDQIIEVESGLTSSPNVCREKCILPPTAIASVYGFKLGSYSKSHSFTASDAWPSPI